jgi:large subunit ribosomal protein L19e
MNLKKKKNLAAKTLNVGRERIVFLKPRLDEIKEAITKQDIKDLYKDGAIKIKEVKGRRKVQINSSRKNPGKIKKRIKKRKQEYMIITRKLRKYSAELKKQGKISKEELIEIRKRIKNRHFKSKSQLKEQLKIRKG